MTKQHEPSQRSERTAAAAGECQERICLRRLTSFRSNLLHPIDILSGVLPRYDSERGWTDISQTCQAPLVCQPVTMEQITVTKYQYGNKKSYGCCKKPLTCDNHFKGVISD